MQPSIRWHTAAPLWAATLQNGQQAHFKRPAILRFAGDTFMEDLEAQLNQAPEQLLDYVARPESWRESQSDWLGGAPFAQTEAFKLYQPAHGRFYLAAASLVCRIPGLPDKATDPANEQLFFVLRKLVAKPGFNQIDPANENSYDEYGWQNESWSPVSDRRQIEETEERLPLFFTAFKHRRQPRRLLAGLIPVARRETYQAAPLNGRPVNGGPAAGDAAVALLMGQFGATVTIALDDLAQAIDDGNPTTPQPVLSVERAREIFLFALLDLAEFLQNHLNEVWRQLPSGSGAGLSLARQTVLNRLQQANNFAPGVTWATVLVDVAARVNDIVAGTLKDIPTALAQNMTRSEIRSTIKKLIDSSLLSPDQQFPEDDAFYKDVKAVLADSPALSLPNDFENLKNLAQVDTQGDARYVIRCVYERPACLIANLPADLKNRLATGQQQERIVSDPSPAFRLAAFFDSDAPVRPVRITMPLDVSLEGLRQFPKNVSILISDELQRQIERVQDVKLADLDEGQIGDDPGLTLGMICSLSIPIITICALILLMIIVQLLNIVFWWLPFFKICLPLPLKAKG